MNKKIKKKNKTLKKVNNNNKCWQRWVGGRGGTLIYCWKEYKLVQSL
jgi:hypothetical protein